jgi:hypothetical protein
MFLKRACADANPLNSKLFCFFSCSPVSKDSNGSPRFFQLKELGLPLRRKGGREIITIKVREILKIKINELCYQTECYYVASQ